MIITSHRKLLAIVTLLLICVSTEAVSQESDPLRRTTKPRWKVTISPMVGYSIPTGVFYQGIEGSLDFGVAVSIAVSHKASIRFGAGKVGMKEGEDTRVYPPNYDWSVASQQFDWSSGHYYAALQLNTYTSRYREKLSMAYLYAGIGSVSHKYRLNVVFLDHTDGSLHPGTQIYSENKFAMNLGLGATNMINRTIGLEFGVHIDMVFVGGSGKRPGPDLVYKATNAHILEAHTGLIFYM
ncbi:MAG: hypothetical protein V3T31_00340 [candidate division Zixibacteria bacterium]